MDLWAGGPDKDDSTGVYGAKGVAAAGNIPGARDASISWTDDWGNLWLFGGDGYDGAGGYGPLNDLWKYDPAAGMWTWVSGSDTTFQSGVYGTKGAAATGSIPGAREKSISWTDSTGNLWLFGGNGCDGVGGSGGRLNDLWKYDPAAGMWTWVSGSNTAGDTGVYGTKGVAAAENIPGAREDSVCWTDGVGNRWLFGGLGYDSAGFISRLNDLWKYDSATDMWIWASGSDTVNQSGVYGTKGAAATGNIPGARNGSMSWIDSAGNLWLFGGGGYDGIGWSGNLNDLWKYDPAADMWTWVGGSDRRSKAGVYGTKGVAAAGNVPGARNRSISWTDSAGNLWLFGGYGCDGVGNSGVLNDLWKYNPDADMWTWIGGSDTIDNVGVYGTKGVAATANIPGARSGSISWTDGAGNLWLCGGHGYDGVGSLGEQNDLWKWKVVYGIHYVDGNAHGNNDGTSWENAYNEVFDALAAAQRGDEIRVAAGTYKPDSNGLANTREASFALKNGVSVKGGYAGYGAVDPNERNIELYETILSGDLLGNDTAGLDPCDLLDDPSRAENCYHVFYNPEDLDLNASAILDGCTITGGQALVLGTSHLDAGGGMFNRGNSPSVTNCRFAGNCGWSGGGMHNAPSSSPTVTGCTFVGNVGVFGGGMHNRFSSPVITGCTFEQNFATRFGGGVLNRDCSSATITGCMFRGNRADQGGGGMCDTLSSRATVRNCTFSGNAAQEGGGMHNIEGFPILINCIFWRNSAPESNEIK